MAKFIARCQQQQRQRQRQCQLQQQLQQQQQKQQQHFAAAFYRLFVVFQRATLQLATTVLLSCLFSGRLVVLFCIAAAPVPRAACHSCCCCCCHHGHHLLICMQFIFLSAIFIVLPAVDFLRALQFRLSASLPHCLIAFCCHSSALHPPPPLALATLLRLL